MVIVKKLTEKDQLAYDAFIASHEHSLFYHSNRFRLFLKALLNADDHYLLAFEDGDIVGALPAFRVHGPLGSCLNSLPFFGSNGGMITGEGREQARAKLLRSWFSLAAYDKTLAANIITSPFENHPAIYTRFFDQEPADYRIGQITELPSDNHKNAEAAGEEEVAAKGVAAAGVKEEEEGKEKELFDVLDPFTRRMIRKATKKQMRVEEQNDAEALHFLACVHEQNMKRIGGKKKPPTFFKKFPEFFRAGEDYKIWTAWQGDKMVAALLLFYYNHTVEYYIPAILQRYRSDQPQSLIIYRAMLDAAANGYRYWNWGGTWPSQEGVYRFKNQWNTQNRYYYYYHFLFDQTLLDHSREEIQEAFPYSYVVPFNRLETAR